MKKPKYELPVFEGYRPPVKKLIHKAQFEIGMADGKDRTIGIWAEISTSEKGFVVLVMATRQARCYGATPKFVWVPNLTEANVVIAERATAMFKRYRKTASERYKRWTAEEVVRGLQIDDSIPQPPEEE